jgi:hypothetical protein
LTIESRPVFRFKRRPRESIENKLYTLRVARVSLDTDPEAESIATGDRKDASAPRTKVK